VCISLHLQLTTILRQKEQTAEDCRNSYILQLEKTNADRQRHFHSTMPAVFKVKGRLGGRLAIKWVVRYLTAFGGLLVEL